MNQIILNADELKLKRKLENKKTKKIGNSSFRIAFDQSLFTDRMLASDSLFPCYYNYPYIKDKELELKKVNALNQIICDPTSTERDILNFFKLPERLRLLSVLFNDYRFGHHDQYIFREFPLPNRNHIADFLLIGKNSDGFHEVFVEFEAINSTSSSKIFTTDKREGAILRKGREQIQDWENSLTRLYSAHSSKLREYVNPKKQLPDELQENYPTRRNYLIVAGRRTDFQENYNTRLDIENRNNIKLLHYDNLVDDIKKVLNEKNVWL